MHELLAGSSSAMTATGKKHSEKNLFLPPCPPQIPHGLAWGRILTSTATNFWPMVWP